MPPSDAPAADAAPAALPAERPRRRAALRRVRPFLYAAVILVVLAFAGVVLYRQLRDVRWHEVRLSPWPLAAAVACLVVVRVMNATSIELILRSLGSTVGFAWSITSMCVACSARYIPGVSPVGLTVLLTRGSARLPAVLAAMVLSNALMLVVAALTAIPLLVSGPVRQRVPHAWVGALVILAGGLVCLHVRAFVGICNALLVRLKRPPLATELRHRPYFLNLGLLAIRAAVMGGAGFFAALAIADVPAAQFPVVMAATAVSTVAGFLAFFVPAGLGVQEVVFTATFYPLLGPHAALHALIFRALQTLTDILTGLAGAAMLRRYAPG